MHNTAFTLQQLL